mgnify:CR=1 FL=1
MTIDQERHDADQHWVDVPHDGLVQVVMTAAEADVDYKACAALIREGRGCIELQARLLGELQAAQGQTVASSPHWTAYRDAIVVEMGDDPALLERFVAAVRRAGERMRTRKAG